MAHFKVCLGGAIHALRRQLFCSQLLCQLEYLPNKHRKVHGLEVGDVGLTLSSSFQSYLRTINSLVLKRAS